MNFYDDQSTTTRQLFERFFPGREDVIRLLMEPITYANGSTLEDPAITYGIVFSNFMSKGVYTFAGGTTRLVHAMQDELRRNGVDLRIRCNVDRILVDRGRVCGVEVHGRVIPAAAVVSNANLKATVFDLVGESHFDRSFVEQARQVRLNNSSTQVYMALKPDRPVDPSTGDLLFSSRAPLFRTELLLSRQVTSRTYSFYYPESHPGGRSHTLIVSSTNANYQDWADLPEEEYQASKRDLIETTLDALEQYVPQIRARLDYVEAATPAHLPTLHATPARRQLRHEVRRTGGQPRTAGTGPRLVPRGQRRHYHVGLAGAINYGVIVANEVDSMLLKAHTGSPSCRPTTSSP